MTRRLHGAVLASCVLLAGCAGLGTIEEPPKVSLVGIVPERLELLEQRYRVTLRVLNPNEAPLTVRGVSYEIELNGKPFGTGVSGEAVTVPGYGETTVSVTVLSSLGRLYEQFRQYQASKEARVSYALEGKLSVDGIAGRVAFDHSGEIDLGELPLR